MNKMNDVEHAHEIEAFEVILNFYICNNILLNFVFYLYKLYLITSFLNCKNFIMFEFYVAMNKLMILIFFFSLSPHVCR